MRLSAGWVAERKVLVDKSALDALLRSAVPAAEGDASPVARELQLDELVADSVRAAHRSRGRAKNKADQIDPLDQFVTIVLGVPESLNRRIRAEVTTAGQDIQAYLRAVLHLAARAGLLDHVTREFVARKDAATDEQEASRRASPDDGRT